MIIYERLIKKSDRIFKSFVGLSKDEFNALYDELLLTWNKRFDRKDRKRKVGGGRKMNIPNFATELVLILFFYRHYASIDVLSVLFNLDSSNICRHINTLESIFAVLARRKLSRPKYIKKIKSLEELLEKAPELKELIGDATEQSINRPKNKAKQKKHYSGKKKSHKIKHQIVIRKDKRIYLTSKTYPGSTHDKIIFEKEQTIDKIPKPSITRLDNAYQKADKDNPEHNFVLPKKANRWHKLELKDKRQNKKKVKERIYVEHVIGKLKVFRILSDKYRRNLDTHTKVFKNICGLYNFRFDLVAVS